MTDERDPGGPASAASDETTRIPTPAPTPTAPLTPASGPTTTASPYDHEVPWTEAGSIASVTPVTPVGSGAAKRSRGRLRWAAAIVVVALVLGTSAALAALLTGGSSTATVLGYVPAGTTMYGEVRLDLPGDQRRALGEFLSAFPGFADQAALDSKLDEMLDELVEDASDGDQSYTGDVKAWFDGELAVSTGPLPPAAGFMNGDPSALDSFRALGLMSVKDPVAATAWFAAAVTENGATSTTETYGGTTLTVFGEDGGPKAAYAVIDGKVAVFGDISSVRSAVDTKGSSDFASEPGPKAAFGSVDEDYVGFVYVALRPLMDWSNDLSESMAGEFGGVTTAASEAMLDLIPDWGAYWLRFESDALVMEASAPMPKTVLGPTENRTSTVVDHIPGSAIVASTTHDLGATLKQMLAVYGSDASMKPFIDELDKGLGLVGGGDAAFGWAGDTAFVIDDAAGTPQGGVVIVPTDQEAAERLFTALRTFIAIGGGQQGVSVRDEAYNGTTITIIDLGDIGALAGMAGGAEGMPLPTGNLEIAIAVTDDVVVIGSGPAFVKAVIDTTSSTSLASVDAYEQVAGRTGAGTGMVYVDLTAIREMFETTLATSDPASLAEYESDLKPFLLPFEALVGSTSVSGDLTKSTIFITVE